MIFFSLVLQNQTDMMQRTAGPVVMYLVVDSRARNYDRYPTPSQYRVDLPRKYFNVTDIRIVSAELPITFYSFCAASLSNTSMTVAVNGTSKTVTIPDGNYDGTSLSLALQTALNAAFAQPTLTTFFTVTIDPITLAMTISCSGGVTTSLAVDTTTALATGPRADWGLAYNCGFPRGVVTSGVVGATAGSMSVTGTQAVNVNTETYVLMCIDGLDNVDVAGLYGSGQSNKCFAKVTLNGSSGDVIYFDKPHLTHNRLNPPRDIVRIDTSWRFADGTLVDWKGCEHSFTLEITCTETRSSST